MSRDNNDNLPSYKDFLEKPSDDLPSLEEVLEENLPSVNDFLPSQVEEETQTIENSDGDSFLEVTDVVRAPEWSELVRLVNDVRKDIPQIPEIKSYDDELEGICSQIEQIQTNFSLLDAKSDKITDLSAQNEEFEVKLTEIESKIPEVPEVRYYEGDIELIYGKISRIKEEIESLPEVKYYDKDLETLKSRIEEVNKAIPTFPDWVQEVQEVPDFSWIGKTFSLIDDDFNKVQGHLDIIREKIDYQVNELNDSVEKKEFDLKVDIKNLNSSLNDTNIYLGETKDKIYKEIKDSSIRIWEHHKEFKDDDRKLKKAILSEQNKLKQSLQKEIEDINEKSVKADESILKFFTDLKETVDTLPEVKYYDDDISNLRKEFNKEIKSTKGDIQTLVGELYKIASVIKKQQKTITEGYLLNEPPEQKQTAGGQTDPLTPEDQKFATLKDLSAHYRLFINRVQTQLSTIGGGGAGFIKDLDDVEFDGTVGNNKLLIYDQANSKWVGIASTALGGGTGVASTDFVSGIAITMTTGNFTNVNVSGTITYDDVTRLDSLGFSTFRSGLEVNTGTATTALLVNGDARITGILSVGTETITLDPTANKIQIGTGITLDANTNSIEVGGSKIADTSGNANYSGIVTATGFVGNITGVAATFTGDIKSGGKLLVGTDTEGAALADNLTVADTGDCGITIRSGTSNYGSIYFSDATSGADEYRGQIEYNHNTDILRIYSGGTAVLRIDPGKLDVIGHTETDSLKVTGLSTFTGSIDLPDSSGDAVGKALFGDSNDLKIYHDGANSYISDVGTGDLRLSGNIVKINNNNNTATMVKATEGGSVELNHNGTKKFETTASGIDVTGHTETDSLEVSGIATVSTAFYMPQYTTTARDAATFNEGAMIYNTTTKKMEFYDGTSWTSLPGMSLGLTVALDG